MNRLLDFFIHSIPELFFLGFGVWVQVDSGAGISPLGTGLITLMCLQLIWKNKILAGVCGGLLFLGSLYLILALLSDFHKFSAEDGQAAYRFLATGGSLIFASIVMALSLMLKASRKEYRLWA